MSPRMKQSGQAYELDSLNKSSQQYLPVSDGSTETHETKEHTHQNEYYSGSDDEATELASLPPPASPTSVRSFQLYTPDEEKIVRRKIDRHVVLFMSFLYLLSFLDRSNIGNAKIAGMTTDLNLEDDQFDWLLTAFYITYIAFEWMILLYHILTPHIYIAICVGSWGILASLQALCTSFWQLLVIRALLGVGEAAFSPGVPYYLSFFYRREELALRAGIQVSAAPLAASFAGSLAYLITKVGTYSPIAPWRVLFLVEGFPSIIVAIIAWSVVPDSPETAKFLTPRERRIAKLRLRKDHAAEPQQHPGLRKRVDWRGMAETLRDPKCYLTALMFLNCNIAFSSMPVFLPTVINEMGYSSISSQALSAPPYLFAFVVLLLTARASDRLATRSPFVIFHAVMSGTGYLLIAIGGYYQWPNFVRYLCVYPAAAGFFSAITIIITWTMNNQESEAKKGTGMTILNVIGQCGPLLGTRLYPDTDGPYYVKGMSVCAAAMALVCVLAFILRIVLVRENKARATQEMKSEAAEGLMNASSAAPRSTRFVLLL